MPNSTGSPTLPDKAPLPKLDSQKRPAQRSPAKPVGIQIDSVDTRAFVIDAVERFSPQAVAITLSAVDGLPIAYRPGQYVSLTVRLPDGGRVTRSYSIATAPGVLAPEQIRIGVKRVEGGRVSPFLTQDLQPGQALELRGPFGDFGPALPRGAQQRQMLLIAGGSGITPLLNIAQATLMTEKHSAVTLIHRASHRAAMMFDTELEALEQQYPGRFQHLPFLSTEGLRGPEGWRQHIRAAVSLPSSVDVFLCGPQGMQDEAISALTSLGCPAESIHIEQFVAQLAQASPASGQWPVTLRQGATVKTYQAHEAESLLDAAEQVGLAVTHSCRVGTCGSCKVKLLEGEVHSTESACLSQAEKESGVILSCVSTARTPVSIELPEVNQAVDAHPAVIRWFDAPRRQGNQIVSRDELAQLALECGADDVGFASVDRDDLAGERPHLAQAFPQGRTYICLVRRMNSANVRSPERSIANADFHHTMDDIQHVARRLADALTERGIKAFCAPPAFPMEMDRFPERGWVIAHKTIAEASGVGRIGLHRNVIHPRFGNFILLDTIVIDRDVDLEDRPLDENPCIGCNLCVAACPVGAISTDGHFDFTACYTHNYREFMSGFTDWVEQVADAKSAKDYRAKVSDSETVSMWQSLSFGPNYKAAYCLSVCPAGSDVIGDFLANRKQFVQEVLQPLQNKSEPIYVVPGSDAERYVKTRFPHKPVRRVSNGLRVRNIKGFLHGLPISFQRGRAGTLSAVYHFTFTGEEPAEATVTIHNRKIQVEPGLNGRADLAVTVDSASWVRFLRREAKLLTILATRKLKLKGSPKLLAAFGRCFL
ncbi:MAG: 2Fe-2S iron-sulfur cluster binding domain-containing protein [Burkholderiales bacterium]|nr:2Fe-2S iron-sulfur cluster binding domain-containing protein [Burkholderiales bacterium]